MATTFNNIIELENKKTMAEKAKALNEKVSRISGKIKKTIDIKDARNHVKATNELIKQYNLTKKEDEQIKLIKNTFEQELSPKDRLPMTLKITKNGFMATIGGKISFLYDINDEKWHEVKIFGVSSSTTSLEEYKLEFVTTVSKATIKLIKGYGIFTMNVEDRKNKIVADKMEECAKVTDLIIGQQVTVIKANA